VIYAQINKLMERIVEANCLAVIAAYERTIMMLYWSWSRGAISSTP